MNKKLEDAVNTVDTVAQCLRVQTENIVHSKMGDEEKAQRLGLLAEGQGAALLSVKMELEEAAGRPLKSPVLLVELDEDPCIACIVVSQMKERGIADDCLECDRKATREAFLATQTDGSGD